MELTPYLVDACLNQVVNYLSVTIGSSKDLVSHYERMINDKLSMLIDAPYKASLYHLREGDKQNAKEEIIKAISTNPFNIPARLLYISLVADSNPKYAAELYAELFEDFTTQSDIFPTELYSCLAKSYRSFIRSIVSNTNSFVLEDYGYPTEMWLTSHGYVILWNTDSISRFFSNMFFTYGSWGNSREIVKMPCKSIICVTDKYICFQKGQEYRFYDFSNNSCSTIPCEVKTIQNFSKKGEWYLSLLDQEVHNKVNADSGSITINKFVCMPYKKQHREERVAYYYDGQPVMEHITKECKEYHLANI